MSNVAVFLNLCKSVDNKSPVSLCGETLTWFDSGQGTKSRICKLQQDRNFAEKKIDVNPEV